MGFYYTIRQQENGALVTAEGEIDMDDCRRIMVALAEEPRFQSDYAVIIDLRLIKQISSVCNIEAVASMLVQMEAVFQGRLAVVADDTLLFGLARMLCSYVEMAGFHMIPFRDFDSAQKWAFKLI